MSFDILLRRSRVGFFPASATRRARRWAILLALAVVCCLASSGAHAAHTISWGRVGTVTTLTNGQLCTNDGWNITCDSTTPTIASGLVGIGSTAPVVSLDLSQETDALALPVGTSGMRPTGANLANGELRYNSTLSGVETYVNGTWDTVLTAASLGSSLPAAGSNGQVQFNSGGDLGADSNFFWDNTNKRLGIGVTSPSDEFDLAGSLGDVVMKAAGNEIDFTRGGINNIVATNAAGLLTFGTANTTRVTINSSGNVGIGTTSPTSLLQTYDSAAKTATYTGVLHDVFDASTTASVNKVGMDIESTGSWSGTGAVNTGLVVNATGGATNYAATFSGGNVGIGTTSPGATLQAVNSSATMQFGSTDGLGNTNTPSLQLYRTGSSGWTKLEIGANAAGSSTQTAGIWVNGGGEIRYVAASGWFPTFYSSGSEAMRISTAGNVGIGTTSPIAPLHIFSGSGVTTPFFFVGQGTTNRGISIGAPISTTVTAFIDTQNGGVSTRYLDFRGEGVSRMVLTSGGNLGIGTTAPLSSLSVAGNLALGAYGGGASTTLAPTNGLIVSGNVGIGTTSPGSSLQVNGGEAVGYSTSTAAPTNGLTVSGNVGVGTASVPTGVTANINGTVKVAGTGSEPCTASQVGSMRYNPTGQYMEICTYP
jgi:hypothetical protein